MVDQNKKTIVFDFGNVLINLDFERCFTMFEDILYVDWSERKLPQPIVNAIQKYDRGQISDEALIWAFQNENPKGALFYLHGNYGSLNLTGVLFDHYYGRNYDIFAMDYRGFGKSQGNIRSEEVLLGDVQKTYDHLRTIYPEDDIHIIGHSLGAALASKVGCENNPRQIILLSPFFNLKEMINLRYPLLPTFLSKYTLDTHQYLKNCDKKITIFHGKKDKTIPFHHSVLLKQSLGEKIDFQSLENQDHNDFELNFEYQKAIDILLP